MRRISILIVTSIHPTLTIERLAYAQAKAAYAEHRAAEHRDVGGFMVRYCSACSPFIDRMCSAAHDIAHDPSHHA